MVPSAPAVDAYAGSPWVDRLRRIVSRARDGVVVGAEGGVSAAARPVLEILAASGAPVHVCLSGSDMLKVPPHAWIVLLNAARDASWLNLSRPVVTERDLRVLVWLNPGDRVHIREEAPDFLDWMQQTVDLPPLAPGYAVAALDRVLNSGGLLAWIGSGIDELLPASVARRKVTDGMGELAQVIEQGPLAVRGIASAEEVRALWEIHRGAGQGNAMILVDPPFMPPFSERVVVPPLVWEEAAEWLVAAGVSDAGRVAAELDLDPDVLSVRAGLERPGPGPLPKEKAGHEEPATSKVSDRAVTKRRREVPSADLYHAFDPFQPAKGSTRVPRPQTGKLLRAIQLSGGSDHARLFAVVGGPGSGKSTEIMSILDGTSLTHVGIPVDLGGFGQLEAEQVTLLVGVALLRAGGRLGLRFGSEASALFTRLLPESVRARRDFLSFRRDLPRLFEAWLARDPSAQQRELVRMLDGRDIWGWPLLDEIHDLSRVLAMEQERPLLLLLDGLDHQDSQVLSRLGETRSLLTHPLCSTVLTLSHEHCWFAPMAPLIEHLATLFDLPVVDSSTFQSSSHGQTFLRSLLEARLATLEPSRVPSMLRSDEVLERLSFASGGSLRTFVRLIRDLAVEYEEGEAPGRALNSVVDDYRRMLSSSLYREDYALLREICDDPQHRLPNRERAQALVRTGHIRVYEGADGPWYLPRPLLLEAILGKRQDF